jgi:hypothetical protein
MVLEHIKLKNTGFGRKVKSLLSTIYKDLIKEHKELADAIKNLERDYSVLKAEKEMGVGSSSGKEEANSPKEKFDGFKQNDTPGAPPQPVRTKSASGEFSGRKLSFDETNALKKVKIEEDE